MTLGTNFDETKAAIENVVGTYGEFAWEDYQTIVYKNGDKLIYFEFNGTDFSLQGLFVDGIYGFDDGAFYIKPDDTKDLAQMFEQAKQITITL